jgi:hypothetical protein
METHDSHAFLACTVDKQTDYFGRKNASHAFIEQDMEEDARRAQTGRWIEAGATLLDKREVKSCGVSNHFRE